MVICAPNVLTAEELSVIHASLSDAPFIDGASTAGWSAREVKKNLQLAGNSQNQAKLEAMVQAAFLRSTMLQMATLPAAMTRIMFNRYDLGMQYGPHVDAAVMGSLNDAVRSDIALTIFLSDPKTYSGGDLVMDVSGVSCGFKLEAGSAIAYPANSLHHVTAVTRGARYAAIIWIQSQVRDAGKRELLWDLDNAKREIFGREGKSAAFDAISRSHANLLRMWADP